MIIKIIRKFRQNWLLFIFLILITIAVITIGYFYNRAQTQKTIDDFSNQLNTLADLKSMQITLWRHERLVDGQTIQTDESFTQNISLLISDPENLTVLKENQDRLSTLLLDPNYSSVFLVNSKGKILLQVGNLNDKPSQAIIQKMSDTSLSHEVELTDLYLNSDNSVRMDMVVPLYLSGNQKQPALAYLIYEITPDPILYPLIQSLPTNYQTAETLLVRKEDDGVLFMNELRFQKNTALKPHLSFSNSETPAVMAAKGIVGIVNGIDYRGVPVMASIVPVQDSNWILIAKLDRNEIYKPINQQLLSSILISILLLIVAGLAISLLWRRQSASISKGLSDSEVERKNLEEKYSTLFNQANDAILLLEENGKIVEANDQAVKMYGYSREEMLTLSVSDLRSPTTKPWIPQDMDRVKNHTANLFETTHRKKNGELFQVDVSSRYLSVGEKGFFQSLVRDVTQRKLAEEQLSRSELALKKAQQVSHVGSWYWNLETGFAEGSDEMFRILGIDRSTWKRSFRELIAGIIHPDDLPMVDRAYRTAIENQQIFTSETRIIRPDRSIRDVWIEAGEIMLNKDREIVSISGIVQDITEKKAAERELRKSENLLQRIYDLLPVGLWITDKTGKLIRSNKMVSEIWGKDILVGIEDFNVFHGRRLPSREEINPDDWASVHTIKEGITVRDELVEIDAYDGKTKTILNYSTPILDEKGELEGSIILNLDITELKKAEEQLSSQLDELRRWNLATLGRETRIRELKTEINDLMIKNGLPPKYQSVVDDHHE